MFRLFVTIMRDIHQNQKHSCNRIMLTLFCVISSLFIFHSGNRADAEYQHITGHERENTLRISKDASQQIRNSRVIGRTINIFNNKFRLGWIAKTWNGLTLQEMITPNGRNILSLKTHATTRPWSGVKVRSLLGINSVNLDEELIKRGNLVLSVNGGADIYGNHTGEQDILLYLQLSGTTDKPRNPIRVQEYITGQWIDNHPETWQRIAIPLKKFIKTENSEIRLNMISIQFRGAPPKGGIQIDRILLEINHEPGGNGFINTLSYPADISFAERQDIDPALLMPPFRKVGIDAFGNFTIDGRPRYLVGAQLTGGTGRDWSHTSGHGDAYHWLYDKVPDYESSQRIGFDSMGLFIPPIWTLTYLPRDKTRWIMKDASAVDKFTTEINLPLYVDLTCSKWGHGILASTPYITDEAKTRGRKSHYLPYSVIHPEGIRLYKEFWKSSASMLLNNNVHPLLYELFNEPAYEDDSIYSRQIFVAYLKKKYGTIDDLNTKWNSDYKRFDSIASFKTRKDNPGLFVEYGKFLEKAFTELYNTGRKVIRETDTRAETMVTFQPGGEDWYRSIAKSNVNPYEVSKSMDIMLSGTGGGTYGTKGLTIPVASSIESSVINKRFEEGILMAHYFRNLAGNKPIVNGEFNGTGGPYRRTDRRTLRNDLWLEAARGYNATYLFKWKKDSYLDPSRVPTDALLAIMDFKRDLKVTGELIVHRPRNIKRDIALLISYPTERMAPVRSESMSNEILTYTGALEFSHWPYDIILEEQLPSGKLKKYKVLIAAGVNNIYPESVIHLEKFIREGGVLIMGIDIPAHDEYGNRLNWKGIEGLALGAKVPGGVKEVSFTYPNWDLLPGKIRGISYKDIRDDGTWQAIGSIGDNKLVYKKNYGNGKLYFIGIRMPEYSLAAILGKILSKEKASRYLNLTDYERGDLCPNIEVHMANRNNNKTYFFYNWDSYSKLCYLYPVTNEMKKNRAYDPLSEEKYEISDKGVLIHLSPQNKKVIMLSEDNRREKLLVPVRDSTIKERYTIERNKEAEARNVTGYDS